MDKDLIIDTKFLENPKEEKVYEFVDIDYLTEKGFSVTITGYNIQAIKHKVEFACHIDEYDEDVYNEDLVCFSKLDWGEGKYQHELSIHRTCPGIGKEVINFTHLLPYNIDLTVNELETICKTLNIDLS